MPLSQIQTISFGISSSGGDEDSDSGGGGGGGSSSPYNKIGSTPKNVTMTSSEIYYFAMDGGSANHTIRILKIGNTSVTFNIRSLSLNVTMTAGEQKQLDIEGGVQPDVVLKLVSFTPYSARFSLAKPAAAATTPTTPTTPATEETTTSSTTTGTPGTGNGETTAPANGTGAENQPGKNTTAVKKEWLTPETKKWIWVIPVVLVICVGAFFAIRFIQSRQDSVEIKDSQPNKKKDKK
jgi:hypothetical protein